jgi:hypothetical protein
MIKIRRNKFCGFGRHDFNFISGWAWSVAGISRWNQRAWWTETSGKGITIRTRTSRNTYGIPSRIETTDNQSHTILTDSGNETKAKLPIYKNWDYKIRGILWRLASILGECERDALRFHWQYIYIHAHIHKLYLNTEKTISTSKILLFTSF